MSDSEFSDSSTENRYGGIKMAPMEWCAFSNHYGSFGHYDADYDQGLFPGMCNCCYEELKFHHYETCWKREHQALDHVHLIACQKCGFFCCGKCLQSHEQDCNGLLPTQQNVFW